MTKPNQPAYLPSMNGFHKRAIIESKLMALEGLYSDDPSDSGGKTKFGITEALARKYGYKGEMANMPKEKAYDILCSEFWDPIKADYILPVAPEVAVEMVEISVNMGAHRAVTFLQRCLNVLNINEKMYPDLKVDGIMGNVTLGALRSHIEHRSNGKVLAVMLNCLQGTFYIELAERRDKDEKFIFGWIKNRVEI